MRILEITAGWQETQSLGNYCNVKPNVILTAVLEPGDDEDACRELLLSTAKASVREQVDRALESEGQPAKYDPCPRFNVWKRYRGNEAIIVAPPGVGLDAAESWYIVHRGLRLAHALRTAQANAQDAGIPFYDCRNGDLSRIPPVHAEADTEPPEAPF